eukprot:gene111-6528_t
MRWSGRGADGAELAAPLRRRAASGAVRALSGASEPRVRAGEGGGGALPQVLRRRAGLLRLAGASPVARHARVPPDGPLLDERRRGGAEWRRTSGGGDAPELFDKLLGLPADEPEDDDPSPPPRPPSAALPPPPPPRTSTDS